MSQDKPTLARDLGVDHLFKTVGVVGRGLSNPLASKPNEPKRLEFHAGQLIRLRATSEEVEVMLGPVEDPSYVWCHPDSEVEIYKGTPRAMQHFGA
jgi:hypothetical protein